MKKCSAFVYCFVIIISTGNTLAHQDEKTIGITRVLDKLLTDYNKNIRPTFHKGIPTVVNINMNIKSVGPISSLDMSYSMDIYFRQEWKDPRLAFDAPYKQITLSIKMLEQIWKPDTYFLNGKESYLHAIPTSNRLVRLSRDGSILFSSRLTVKAACPMNLRDFPLDKQMCPLWVGSFSYSTNETTYNWLEKRRQPTWKPIQIDDRVKLSQFDILSTSWNSTKYIVNNNIEYKFIGVHIGFKRHTGFYVLQVYIPSAMLVIISWVSFYLKREATSDRSSIGIMCILSLATLSFDIKNEIPNVPYSTALDYFLIMCYLFLFATMFEFGIVHYFTKIGFEDFYEPDSKTDRQRLVSFELSNFNVKPNVPFMSWPYIEYYFKVYSSNFLKCITSDTDFKDQMKKRAKNNGANSVSSCDIAARFIFPGSFALFNVIYWIVYLIA